MDAAEIIDSPEQKYGTGHSLRLTGQAMRAPDEGRQIGAEGAVEAFNESSVNDPIELSGVAQAGQHGGRAAQDIALDSKGVLGSLFNDLGQRQTRPDTVDQASPPTTRRLVRKSAFEGVTVSAKAVKGNVQSESVR